MTVEKKLTELQPKKDKPTHASMLFPELLKELTQKPELVGNAEGLFMILVTKNGKKVEEWYLVFRGRDKPPTISQDAPAFPKAKTTKIPVTIVEIEDRDIFKFITGGLPGLKALSENRIKIAGDIGFAMQLEEIFNKTGGVEKTKEFIRKAKALAKSKL
ncbi:hypothetical protein HDV06_003507 [Boothiomyces sp. JEL0866]|nr:hypothetical protein HDV06_003476 [Boothiomyces sp. JEL0866]KAJ3325737.1 hypothetical protein HDV06_003507 [Boothiomyces sp. JEL0866]